MVNEPARPAPVKAPEQEYRGSILKHPYLLYIIFTGAIFAFLVAAAWLGLKYGWIPSRGGVGGASAN